MVVPESCISSLLNSIDRRKKTNIPEDFALFDFSNLKMLNRPMLYGFAALHFKEIKRPPRNGPRELVPTRLPKNKVNLVTTSGRVARGALYLDDAPRDFG